MAAYVLAGGADHVFDPATGAGVFFRAAKQITAGIKTVELLGTEIDTNALLEARLSGLTDGDLENVLVRDFVLNPPDRKYAAIVANPPYIRHHRVPAPYKLQLRALGAKILGKPLDGRAGIHIYFLLRALLLLQPHGRLAFIMPADTCEGIFAKPLWKWITRNYALDGVITFESPASPFPGVDTNPMIFLLRNSAPRESFCWVSCGRANTPDLRVWAASAPGEVAGKDLFVVKRSMPEGLKTGFSRPPVIDHREHATLGQFVDVVRGIATGANDFFFLSRTRALELGLPDEYLLPAIGRTRDVVGEEITVDTLRELESKGRPTLLLSVGERTIDCYPEAVREYLRTGESMGLSERPLIKTRRPWYRMEKRRVPPFLFSYLGRRSTRFVRNTAGILPLTGFLCVYPKVQSEDYVSKLWSVLNDPRTLANLRMVGKSYGEGAIKVEPRALESLPIPPEVIALSGLEDTSQHGQIPFSY
jgi:hypothetical protein